MFWDKDFFDNRSSPLLFLIATLFSRDDFWRSMQGGCDMRYDLNLQSCEWTKKRGA